MPTTLKPESDKKNDTTRTPDYADGDGEPPRKPTAKPSEPPEPYLVPDVDPNWWFPPTADRNDIS